ncbi:hypothetical protein JWG40_00075 [Leptospira sp. 201903074]|uniref:hypothetical protein n=1 Tax=Leptospira abararensis TaxID=2810036 RepID=UPI0019668D89|nr:hypothetical protein [Leptospira abararensis]MBM9545396.1 hypothetical protein [Leptospira abararensis]
MFKKIIAASSWLRVQKYKSMEQMFYVSFLYLFLFFSLLFISCGEEKKGSDPSAAFGLLGLASGGQPSSESNDGNLDGVLPPIPPVVGPPALPGQPLNAPILNDPQTQINNAPVTEDQYGIYGRILINNISFQQPVHNQTTITAYIGKRNMKIEQDGTVVNATNYHTLTPATPNTGGIIWFSFIHRSNIKQKLILVARNEFGSSSKEINFSHNRDCIGAPLVPTVIGDCDDHCIETSNVAGELKFEAKYKHGDNLVYLQLDINGTSPRTGLNLLDFAEFYYSWDNPLDPPLPQGVSSISTNLNSYGRDYTCMDLQSFIVKDDETGNFDTRYLTGRIRLE